MKFWPAFFVLLFLSSFCQATTIEDIVNLTELKTDEQVILELIQKDPPVKQITSRDVLYLKEKGVSDRVIQALMSSAEGDGDQVLRSYYKTTKSGKRVRVITNLDRDGRRMGPPPEENPPQEQNYVIPPEITVNVRTEEPERDSFDEDEEYMEDFAEPAGIPFYDTGSYIPYAPYYPYQFPGGRRHCCGSFTPAHSGHYRPPAQHRSGAVRPGPRHRSSSAGARSR